jgi:hypothetical protein
MPLYPFGPNDIFRNQVKTYPKVDFWIYNRKIYYNSQGVDAGAIHSQSLHVEPGYVSLYELNVDRNQNASGQMIYPFITKESGISAFKTVSTNDFNSGYLYGEEIAGEYPLSASIQVEDWKDDATFHDIKSDLSVGRPHVLALQTTFNSYKPLSQHYSYSSSFGHKGQQDLALVSIPSIFFGSSIRKGSVSLKFYITGTLAGELQDVNKNGELIQVSGSANALASTYGSGSVAGVVLYNEGFVALTGSWDLDPAHKDDYDGDSGLDDSPKWIYFGTSANPSPRGNTRGAAAAESVTSSAWQLSFEGVNYIPALTMFAHAPKGWLNHSNNPTYKEHGQSTHTDVALSNSFQYSEPDNVVVKNTVSSSWEVLTASYNTDYQENSASFKRQTFISKIGIYDEQKNLIAVAKMAKPVRKTEEDDFTFKLKLDF